MSKLPADDKVRTWLVEPLTADVARSIERLASADDVRHVVVMPDVHLAGEVCIGAVVATTRLVYPAAVGGDIGCGMATVRFGADAELLDNERTAARLLAGLYQCVPGNRHPAGTMPASLPEPLARMPPSHGRMERAKGRDGRVQLGTLGRGNHFLEFQADEQGQLWLMVHSGSRAMGQAITAHHDRTIWGNTAAAKRGGLYSLDAETDAGQAYLQDVAWALEYAQANRLAMVQAVAGLLRSALGVECDWDSLFDRHHNHVQRETHHGQALWVHRKGAQNAGINEPGIVPGSMGTDSFHVRGRGVPAALASCSHGAGRKLSRSEARQEVSAKAFDRQMRHVWFDRRRSRALLDEAPTAYKDIHAVMRAQRELVRIERRLRPLLSYKA